jgi:hypothetical protein
MEQGATLTRAALKTPRAAAIAGILFSILFIISLVLIRISVPSNPQEAGTWLSRDWRTVSLALHLLPFAGIAFLWFVGVLRDRIGPYEDRLFASAAVAGGIMMIYGTTPGKLVESGTYTFGRTVVYQIINVYAVKMAGVFMISTCTLSMRTRIFPRWMAFLGYGLALLLILSIGYLSWALLVLPLWVLLVSCYILYANLT